MAITDGGIKLVETIVETAVHKVVTEVLPMIIKEIDHRFNRLERASP